MKNDIKNFARSSQERTQYHADNQPYADQSQIDPSSVDKLNIDPSLRNDVQGVINQYSGKSDAELMDELLKQKQAGAIDPGALQGMAQKISPMLNTEQQSRLNEILRKLM